MGGLDVQRPQSPQLPWLATQQLELESAFPGIGVVAGVWRSSKEALSPGGVEICLKRRGSYHPPTWDSSDS